MNFERIVAAVRDDDYDAFVAVLDAAESANVVRDSLNSVRYANWFSGIGATTLQLAAFLRPEFAEAALCRGAEMDLHSACGLGDLERIQRILDESPAALDRQVDSYFPAQFAMRHPLALNCLLENGDDVNRPIQKLAWFEWEDQAAKLGLSDWRLAHMVALGRGDVRHAEVLKAYDADLSFHARPLGCTPIHLSAIYDQTSLIRWFVDNGVDVDERTEESVVTDALFSQRPFEPFDSYQQTPLMLAAGEGQSSAMATLLELGADVNGTDSARFTPLHFAAGSFWGDNPANVDRLIDHGADPRAMDCEGRLPVDLAQMKGYHATVARLNA